MNSDQLALLNRFLTLPTGIPDWVQDHIDSKIQQAEQEFQWDRDELESEIDEAQNKVTELEDDLEFERNLNYDLRRRLEDCESDLDKAYAEIEELKSQQP